MSGARVPRVAKAGRAAKAVAPPASVAAALLVLITGCSGDGGEGADPEPTRLVVSAAASMSAAFEACAPRFGAAENVEVSLSLAGSDELAAQIRQGADVDVFAAANTDLPNELNAEGLLRDPVTFASNEIVIAVPEGSGIGSIDDLAEEGTTLVIGSESAPIGSYTREALAKLPPEREEAILANVRSNEPDVRGIVGKLLQGAADAGFVYATDVTATAGALEAIALPATLEPQVTYSAGVVTGSDRPGAAARFVDGLVSGACAESLRAAGFGPAP